MTSPRSWLYHLRPSPLLYLHVGLRFLKSEEIFQILDGLLMSIVLRIILSFVGLIFTHITHLRAEPCGILKVVRFCENNVSPLIQVMLGLWQKNLHNLPPNRMASRKKYCRSWITHLTDLCSTSSLTLIVKSFSMYFNSLAAKSTLSGSFA